MKCAEIHPNLAAFALGGLEPEEAAEVRGHLASCPSCQKVLRELEEVNHALEAAPSPSTDPPAYLKAEILARVRAEERSLTAEEESLCFNLFKKPRIILPSVAAAAVVAMIALGVFFGFLREEAPVATIQLVPTPQEAAGLKGYWGVAKIRPQPSGNQQVELKLNNFDEPKPDSYYEMWFLSGDRRISAGSFTSVGQGETRVLLNVAPEARTYHTVLITEEHVDNDAAPSEAEVALKGEEVP
jgi:anti-sigma-K factor RskA